MTTESSSYLVELCSIAFQQVPFGLAFVDVDGRIVQLNQAVAELTGIPFDDLIGSRFVDLFEPGPAADAVSMVDRFDGDGDVETKSFELPLRHSDNPSRTVALTLTPISDADGHSQHLVARLDDVTRQREARHSTDVAVNLGSAHSGCPPRRSRSSHNDGSQRLAG